VSSQNNYIEYKLPKGWEKTELENLIQYVIGGDWGKDVSHQDADFQLAYCIRGSEIKDWDEEKGKTASLRKLKRSSIEKRKLLEGDILVEISGGGPEQPVGRTVMIDKSVLSFEPEVPKVCTNFFRLVRPVKEINSAFLNFYLKYFYKTSEIGRYQSGSNNLRNLKFNDYVKVKVPFPKLSTQQQIISKIEELFSELDKGIEQLKTAQQQLKIYRQAVLKAAFEGRLTSRKLPQAGVEPLSVAAEAEEPYGNNGKLPKGWRWIKLRDLLDFIGSGVTPKGGQSVYRNQGVVFIRSQNVYPNELILDDVAFISDEIDEKMKRSRTYSNDVLLNITGASIGRCTFVPENIGRANVNQHVCILRIAQNKVYCKYLSSYLNSYRAQSEIMNTQGGATRQGLNYAQIKSFEIPICSIEEQKQIVQEIESRLSVADKMEETITESLQQAESLRQSILKKAFEGKLI